MEALSDLQGLYKNVKESPRAFDEHTLRGRRRSREFSASCKTYTKMKESSRAFNKHTSRGASARRL